MAYWFQYWWLLVPAIVLGLDAHDLQEVKVQEVPGELTDHYDPRSRTLRLSRNVGGGASVAALGIAALASVLTLLRLVLLSRR